MTGIERLRVRAISWSLFPQTTLKAAIWRLGFVQADPIRSPARAQDLILRHRVRGYRAGDLERRYSLLDIEEDILYAYGFLPRAIWRLLHPRDTRGLSSLEAQVLNTVRKFGVMHPRELQAHFGSARVINAWGSYSKATTRALEGLHYRGLLRVARREDGIRLYEAAPRYDESISAVDRLRKLVMVVAKILAPVSERMLLATVSRLRHLGSTRAAINDLLKAGKLEKEFIDDITYLWPHSSTKVAEAPRTVRFLAPFDPLVWDRARFEHFWGWRYRFEAYTPAVKRVRGYYAMPLLWCDSIVGWANARVESDHLKVDVAFVAKRPKDSEFRDELKAEIGRLETFLKGSRGL
jgi:uncharacterized protein YcaQ